MFFGDFGDFGGIFCLIDGDLVPVFFVCFLF